MNEDTHEETASGLNTRSTVDDGADSVSPTENTSPKPSSPGEPVSEIDLSNPPVQFPSDEVDCDVEEVLKKTVESVVAYVHGSSKDFEPAVPVRDPPPSNDAAEECSSSQNMIPETSDSLHDIESVHDIGETRVDHTDEPTDDVAQKTATTNDDADNANDEDDFGDFGDFSEAQTVESSVVANGVSESFEADFQIVSSSAVKDDNDLDEDDDFGDFEEADLGCSASVVPSDEFARFSESSFSPDAKFLDDSVAPVSPESFRNLIAQLFAVVDHPGSDLLDCPVETGHFQASVHRDIARCENVDDWPCVLFRFDSSRTRKNLLGALCIDETPANCPRFAIDCLSNEFLQPVKESRGGSLPTSRDGRELSEKAKEVLNKIPDLSFMKAEVLTFPTAIQAPWSAL